jgi:hypothetical protein
LKLAPRAFSCAKSFVRQRNLHWPGILALGTLMKNYDDSEERLALDLTVSRGQGPVKLLDALQPS